MRSRDLTARRLLFAALGASLLAGCYTLRPVGGGGPVVGARLAFTINDAGRAALGGSMGPEIATIEGRLVSMDSAEYGVAVTGVDMLRGGSQTWRGEQVRIRREHVTSIAERRFSTVRSVALGAATVGAIAFIVTQPLLGEGAERDPKTPPDTGRTSRGVRP